MGEDFIYCKGLKIEVVRVVCGGDAVEQVVEVGLRVGATREVEKEVGKSGRVDKALLLGRGYKVEGM